MNEIHDDLLPMEGCGRKELLELYQASMEEADEKGFDYLNRWISAQDLLKIGQDYLKDMDKRLIAAGLAQCCFRSLPIPKWCAMAFLNDCYRKIYWDCEYSSWDDVLGKPFPKSSPIKANKKLYKQGLKIYLEVKELKEVNPDWGIDNIFIDVGKRYGLSKTTVNKYYYYYKNSFDSSLLMRN